VLSQNAVNHGLTALVSTVDVSSSTVATISKCLDQINLNTQQTENTISGLRNEWLSGLNDLSTKLDAIQTLTLSTSTTIVSKSTGQVLEVHPSMLKPNNGNDSMQTASDGLKMLPMGMPQMVKDTFTGCLVEFYLETKHGQAHRATDFVNEHFSVAARTKKRPGYVVRQDLIVRNYVRAIGTVTIRSVTTTLRELDNTSDDEQSKMRFTTVTQTNVTLLPNQIFLRHRVFCSAVEQGFALYPSILESSLRVLNVVSSDSPIIGACILGDLRSVRKLIADGQASPFDRLQNGHSMLDITLWRCMNPALAVKSYRADLDLHQELDDVVDVVEELVQYGVELGTSSISKSPLLEIASASADPVFRRSPRHIERLLRLARILIDPSIQIPLREYSTLPLCLRLAPTPVYDTLLSQEVWPIPWPTTRIARRMESCRVTSHVHFEVNRVGGQFLEHRCFSFNDFVSLAKEVMRQCESLLDKLVFLFILTDSHKKTHHFNQDEWGIIFSTCLAVCEVAGLWSPRPPAFFYLLGRTDKQVEDLSYLYLRRPHWRRTDHHRKTGIARYKVNLHGGNLNYVYLGRSVPEVLLSCDISQSLVDDILHADNYLSLAVQLKLLADNHEFMHSEMFNRKVSRRAFWKFYNQIEKPGIGGSQTFMDHGEMSSDDDYYDYILEEYDGYYFSDEYMHRYKDGGEDEEVQSLNTWDDENFYFSRLFSPDATPDILPCTSESGEHNELPSSAISHRSSKTTDSGLDDDLDLFDNFDLALPMPKTPFASAPAVQASTTGDTSVRDGEDSSSKDTEEREEIDGLQIAHDAFWM
jgi:hypothetical protein